MYNAQRNVFGGQSASVPRRVCADACLRRTVASRFTRVTPVTVCVCSPLWMQVIFTCGCGEQGQLGRVPARKSARDAIFRSQTSATTSAGDADADFVAALAKKRSSLAAVTSLLVLRPVHSKVLAGKTLASVHAGGWSTNAIATDGTVFGWCVAGVVQRWSSSVRWSRGLEMVYRCTPRWGLVLSTGVYTAFRGAVASGHNPLSPCSSMGNRGFFRSPPVWVRLR